METTRTLPSSAACGRQLPPKGKPLELAAAPRGKPLELAAAPRGKPLRSDTMNDMKTHDPLRVNARNLRKSMTPQERRLWYDFLKNLP